MLILYGVAILFPYSVIAPLTLSSRGHPARMVEGSQRSQLSTARFVIPIASSLLPTRHFLSLFAPLKHRLAHPPHCLLRYLARLPRPRIQNLQCPPRMLFVLLPPRPHGLNPPDQPVRHLRLALDAPDARCPAT